MGNGKRQSALLVEIIIAVLFFALSATVILDVFATAYAQSTYAAACNAAMEEAQNCEEHIYASASPEQTLIEDGFVANGDTWTREGEGYTLYVELGQEETGAGMLRTAEIRAMRGERELLTLPCARYIPEEVAP